jgi:hypothetical protein
MAACPSRKVFYSKLGKYNLNVANGNQEKMEGQFKEWVSAMENQIAIYAAFHIEK